LALQPNRSPSTAIAFLFSPSPYTLPLQGGGENVADTLQGEGRKKLAPRWRREVEE